MSADLIREFLLDGHVIPACPLALQSGGEWSEQHQRALARYYFASKAGGLAVGVHSTQFAIRDPAHGLYEPILSLVAEEIDRLSESSDHVMVKIAGICGDTAQALAEAESALGMNYHAGLLSMTAVSNGPDEEVLEHCRAVAEVIPIVGFYLQPAVGGTHFPLRILACFCGDSQCGGDQDGTVQPLSNLGCRASSDRIWQGRYRSLYRK